MGKPDKNGYVHMPIVIHFNDYTLMKKLLVDDDISYNGFVNFCIASYLNGDPHMMKVVKTYKETFDVPRNIREKFVLSQRERAKILEDLENEDKENKEKGGHDGIPD